GKGMSGHRWTSTWLCVAVQYPAPESRPSCGELPLHSSYRNLHVRSRVKREIIRPNPVAEKLETLDCRQIHAWPAPALDTAAFVLDHVGVGFCLDELNTEHGGRPLFERFRFRN
ncbi:MAG: hypothetical protein QF773_06915, partial [Lentisphaeria bacterium]|nr:hypothetical protein [Lentisphaeria bacterium]